MRNITERYRGPADLPPQVPFFPLRRAILLPRATLPLNVFEPRYLAMLDAVISTSRLLGIVQPASRRGAEEEEEEEESPISKSAELRRVGCIGRVTSYQEIEDGRFVIAVTGIARCALLGEVAAENPYRIFTVSCERFAGDFNAADAEGGVDRARLLDTLKTYLEARRLSADWSSISKSSTEALVNSLSIVSPYGPEEKQALLEAPSLRDRAETLIALAEMELAAGTDGSSSTLQ